MLHEILETLSDVKPFPEVEDALREIIENHCFESNDTASMTIYPTERETDLIPDDRSLYIFPEIHISIGLEEREVSIHFERRPWGSFAAARMYESKFLNYFHPNPTMGWDYPQIILDTDYITVARFVTYHMLIFGYESSYDFKIRKFYDLNNADMSLAKVSGNIHIPSTIRRAIDKFKLLDLHNSVFFELNSQKCDHSVVLWINCSKDGEIEFYSDWIVNETYFKKVQEYQNYNYISYIYSSGSIMEFIDLKNTDDDLRFLIDFFLFFAPDIDPDSIYVTLDLCPIACYEEDLDEYPDEYWTYEFRADGSESSPEQWQRCMDLVEHFKMCEAAENEKYYDTEQISSIKTDTIETPTISPLNAVKLMDTEPLDFVIDCLEKIELNSSNIAFPGKVQVYDSERICMIFDVCRYPYSLIKTNEGRFVLFLYLSHEQEQIFEGIRLDEETHSFKIDEDIRIISLSLCKDPTIAAIHITYYINALGYDLSKLTFKIVRNSLYD